MAYIKKNILIIKKTMKKNTLFTFLLFFVFIFDGCKKDTTPGLAPNQEACKPKTESTNLSGNNAIYEYTYNTAGKINGINKFIGGGYNVLQDSFAIFDHTTVHYYSGGTNPVIVSTEYDGNFNDGLLPSKAQVAFEEKGITQTDINSYLFFYDTKKRLIKVSEQTKNVVGDWEYDLTITYNNQDNVTALSYENTTGPKGISTITATGYDDKPSPYSGIKSYPFFMHAAWNNYDPEPLFTALSKNNPLGYTMPDGFKREMTYIYNDKGFPTQRMNTNTNISGTYSFIETYGYQCQ